MKEEEKLWTVIIIITMAHGIQYALQHDNIFASYWTIIPLLIGYFVYLIMSYLPKRRRR